MIRFVDELVEIGRASPETAGMGKRVAAVLNKGKAQNIRITNGIYDHVEMYSEIGRERARFSSKT